jgi:hypothetical protein
VKLKVHGFDPLQFIKCFQKVWPTQKNCVTPRAWTMHSMIQLVVTYKRTTNNYGKPLAKSLGSKESWKCSNTMFDAPLTQRWNNRINDDLKQSKEKFKSLSIVKKLHMVGRNLGGEKLAMCWQFSKMSRFGPKKQTFWLHNFIFCYAPRLNFNQDDQKRVSRKGGGTFGRGLVMRYYYDVCIIYVELVIICNLKKKSLHVRFNFLLHSHFLLNWKEKTLKYGKKWKKNVMQQCQI